MKKTSFEVPIYDWEITIVTIYDKNDAPLLREELKKVEAEPKEEVEENIHYVETGAKDGGEIWYDVDHLKQLIILYPWTSESKFIEVLNHEKRHCVDRILNHHRINDREAAAYLDGYISTQIFERLNEIK